MSDASTETSVVEPYPTSEGDAEVASEPRKRGRPRVDNQAPRKSRSKVRRVVPCYVDMGPYTREHVVRYDAGQQLYDLADVMVAAYRGRASTVHKAIGRLTKLGAFKEGSEFWKKQQWQAGIDFDKIKWTNDGDAKKGDGRKVCSHKAIPVMLESSRGHRAGLEVDGVASWIRNNNPDCQTFLDTINTQGPAPAPAPAPTALVETQR